MIDFEEDAQAIEDEGLSQDKLTRLGQLVQELRDKTSIAEEIAKNYQVVTDRMKKLSEEEIPALLEGTGLSEVRLADKTKVIIKETLHASTGANSKYLRAIIKWLEDTGHDDIIKDEVTVPFAKGEAERVAELTETLKSAGYQFDRERVVNNQTFTALIRELMEAQEDVPLTELGVFVRKSTKLEAPR